MKIHKITLIILFTSFIANGQGIFDISSDTEKKEYKKNGLNENQIKSVKEFNKLVRKGGFLHSDTFFIDAISKYSEAIEIVKYDDKVNKVANKNNKIYYYRAMSYSYLAANQILGEVNYWNAIHDFKRFINSNTNKYGEYNYSSNLSLSFLFRGLAYYQVNRNNQGCSDLKKAKKLGEEGADDFMDEHGCY